VKRLACLLLAALALAGSSCGDERGARIVLWHSYRGAERDALQAAAERWNARARGAGEPQLRLVAVPYEAMVDKISAAVPNGNGPDLFIFAHDRIGTWAEAGVIEPISYWVDDATADRYLPVALAALAYRDRLYGLPLAVKCTALFYRKSSVPVPPATTDELVTMGRALTRAGHWGLGYEVHKLYFHAAWLHGFGGQVLDPSGRVDIATPAAAAAADFARLLAGPGGIVPAEPSPALLSSLFNDGKLAMVISGPWFVDEIAKGVDYGIAPLPVVSATGLPAAPYLGVEGVLVSARARDKRAAYRIAAALADDASAIARARAARQIVPNLAAYRDPEVARDPVVSAFRGAAERARAMPSDPAMGAIWSAYDRALEKVVVLGERAPGALSAAHGEAERYARAPAK